MKLNFFHAYPPWSEFFSSFEGDFGFDLFLFWQSCVAAFLDVVIGGRAVETPPMNSVNLLEGLSRTVVYISYSQLITLVMASFSGWHLFEIFSHPLASHRRIYLVRSVYYVWQFISLDNVLSFYRWTLWRVWCLETSWRKIEWLLTACWQACPRLSQGRAAV